MTSLTSICLVLGLAFLLCLNNNYCNAAININNLRIIRAFASSVTLQCPTNFYNEHVDISRIRWLNENFEYSKPDQNVALTPQNLILTSQLSLQLNAHYEYISCGYVTNSHQYVRLGFWKLNFIGIYFFLYLFDSYQIKNLL
jgi:hypothetical protein